MSAVCVAVGDGEGGVVVVGGSGIGVGTIVGRRNKTRHEHCTLESQ